MILRAYWQNSHREKPEIGLGSRGLCFRSLHTGKNQAGKGDLFLISLKAGGLGLNLTAADYVIHMDPWWNF